MSNSVRPPRRQPTRLPRPWDSPGKNTGVGCHFLLQCMKGKIESEVAQLCPTLSDPIDCSPPGSSVHGIFQAEYWSGMPLPSLEYKCTHKHLLNMEIELEENFQINYYNNIHSLCLLFKLLLATYYALKYLHKNYKYNRKKNWIN